MPDLAVLRFPLDDLRQRLEDDGTGVHIGRVDANDDRHLSRRQSSCARGLENNHRLWPGFFDGS
jgi:hypothetical protein